MVGNALYLHVIQSDFQIGRSLVGNKRVDHWDVGAAPNIYSFSN